MPCMLSFFRIKRNKSDSPGDARSVSASTDTNDADIAQRLGRLTLQTRPSVAQQGNGFVGGFNPFVNGSDTQAPAARHGGSSKPVHPPSFPLPSSYPTRPGPLPTPSVVVQIPAPHHTTGQQMSKTMQHALSMPITPSYPPRVDQSLRPPLPNILTRPQSDVTRPVASTSLPPRGNPPSTPQRPGSSVQPPASAPPKPTASRVQPSHVQVPSGPRKRSASSPVSPTASAATTSTVAANRVRCSGWTQAGTRCKRPVLAGPALGRVNPDVDDELERYCHQHEAQCLSQTNCYIQNKLVTFENWIPGYLQPLTQINLLRAMEKPLSDADEAGYIYTFEIRDPGDPDQIHLKIGRTTKLVKRLDQWNKQCGSKEQILRGYHPCTVDPDERSLLKGRVRSGEPGPWCHRLERLVHLEIADLALYAPHYNAQFPNTKARLQASKTVEKKPCSDCGMLHKEIFTFTRVKDGAYNGREWEYLVKPVIEKWARFLETYLPKPEEKTVASS
ncbi:hypothetical protein AcW1_005389 [Taiwanofungus camphoratus]|nr:hypothetical protein AcW1_005389 [Antrodia cinnamomea]